MADLLTSSLLRRSEPTAGSRLPSLAAVAAALWALVAGLALYCLGPLVVWLADGAEPPLAEPLRLGGQLWLVAHRVALEVPVVVGPDTATLVGPAVLRFAPWGLALLSLLLLHRAGRWAAHTGGVYGARRALQLGVVAAAAYGLGGGAVAVLAASGTVEAVPPEAATLAAVMAFAGVTVGAVQENGSANLLLDRVPAVARPALTGGVAAVAVLVAAGGLLVAGSAVAHAERITQVAAALEVDLLGGLLVAGLGAALAPNAAVWGAAFAVGPGFAVGTGTTVAPGAVELGMLPALPALAALPASAATPVTWTVLVVPALAGIASGWLVHRHVWEGRLWRLGGHGLAAGAVAAVLMTVLAGLSGGSAGAGRMAEIGPAPLAVGLATLLEVGAVSALAAMAMRWRAQRRT